MLRRRRHFAALLPPCIPVGSREIGSAVIAGVGAACMVPAPARHGALAYFKFIACHPHLKLGRAGGDACAAGVVWCTITQRSALWLHGWAGPAGCGALASDCGSSVAAHEPRTHPVMSPSWKPPALLQPAALLPSLVFPAAGAVLPWREVARHSALAACGGIVLLQVSPNAAVDSSQCSKVHEHTC